MFHAMHVDRNNPGSISVRGNDTDILIILLTSSHLQENSHLQFDTGFGLDETHINYGWQRDVNGYLSVKWFEGEQVPAEIEDYTCDEEESEDGEYSSDEDMLDDD